MSERNVEIKARIDDLDNTRKAVRELVSGAAPQITMQTDTYFKYDRGRMKLRETRGSSPVCELIVYERPTRRIRAFRDTTSSRSTTPRR